MSIIRTELAPRILEAAETEQPQDDALRAYALFNQAEVKAMGLETWKFDEVEKLLTKADEALEGCKPWFPQLFRNLLKSQLGEPAEGYLAAVRRKFPRDFRSQTLGRAVSRAATEEVTTASNEKTKTVTQMHTCAFCGSQGRDLSLCAGCKKVYYCDKSCQKAGWKGGHKEICGKKEAGGD